MQPILLGVGRNRKQTRGPTNMATDIVDFTDTTGRCWVPHVTVRSLRTFEEKTDIGVFAAVFDALLAERDNRKKKKSGATREQMLRICKNIFGRVGPLITFLYECCVPQEERQVITQTVFDERIDRSKITQAMQSALTALFTFFPEPEEVTQGEGGAAKAGPFVPTAGETSTKLPES